MDLQLQHGLDWRGADLTGWYVSEKLDGCRAYWDGEQLHSRGGHLVHAEAITSALPRGFALDGEIWAGRGQFETARRLTQYGTPDPRVQFIALDAPDLPGDWLDRLAAIRALGGIQVVGALPIPSMDWLGQLLRHVLAAGGEGLIARRPGTTYRPVRSDDVQKLKAPALDRLGAFDWQA